MTHRYPFDCSEDVGPHEYAVCTRCGKAGLHWDHDGDRYVLMETVFKIHVCKNVSPDVADDFEAIE